MRLRSATLPLLSRHASLALLVGALAGSAAAGAHPRLFFDAQGVAALREQAASRPEAWQAFLRGATALREDPPAPPAQERGVHYRVGLALPEPAFAYAITREPRYLEKARRWIGAAMAYEPWGYTYSKPNQDIPAAFLLYGLCFAYDLLHDDLAAGERRRIEAKIGEKASSLYEPYRPKPGRRHSFSQNHTYINAAALGFAGIVLDGRHPAARAWRALLETVAEPMVRTYSPDGYYYEGYHYFEFGVPWIVHALDALERATGQQFYEKLRLDLAKLYVAHSLLPGGHFFDFGDAGRGSADRSAGRMEILGAHGLLRRLAQRYGDPEAAAVADWADRIAAPEREPLWDFVWRAVPRPPVAATIERLPLVHHFENAGVLFARSSWGDDASALAFRCGPPEGHHVTRLLAELPDWRLSTGHAHPDAGSFILFAGGRYLTGDAGYTGVKLTEHHNTVLVDGRGQENDGRHEVFRDVPYERLDRIRVVSVGRDAGTLHVSCDLAAAYPQGLGLKRLERSFVATGFESFRVVDTLEAETPRTLSALIHADSEPRPTGPGRFRVDAAGQTLDVRVEQPDLVDAKVEPQWVIAQGRPGSVELGAREQRGYRLTLTAAPARSARLVVSLKVSKEKRDEALPDSSMGPRARALRGAPRSPPELHRHGARQRHRSAGRSLARRDGVDRAGGHRPDADERGRG